MYNVAPAPGPRRRLGWFPPGRVQCIRWDGASQEASRGFGVEDFERALEPQALEQRWGFNRDSPYQLLWFISRNVPGPWFSFAPAKFPDAT